MMNYFPNLWRKSSFIEKKFNTLVFFLFEKFIYFLLKDDT